MSKNRILSLVLALVMVLGAFGTVFADTVSPAKTQEEAAAFLKDKGVLAGNAAGDLMLEQELRRRDSVILFSKLLNEFDVAKEFAGEPTYTDIKKEDGSFKDPAYVPFLKWGQENEYYVGKPNGEFGWDANLTAQEYSKVLLVALGYTVNGEGSDVKWEEATKKAADLGVFKGFEKVEETKEILRGEMALMTFNALGIKIKGTEQTLAAKLGIELPEADKPAELKIESVYTENLAEIEIALSNAELVNKDKLENADNYRVVARNDSKNVIKIENAEVIGDNVRLTLVPYDRVDKANQKDIALLKDRDYDLTIRNIDRRINEKTQKFTARDNAIPTVEKVEFMGDYGIKVTTSEPIRNAEERFFQVNGKRTSMIIEQYGREIILTPYHNGAFDKDAKELVIGKLEDFAGFRAIETKYDLELAKEDVKPVVKNVYRNNKTLIVEFEQDVFHKSVKAETTRRDLGNVSFRDGRVDFYSKTAKKIDTNLVEYTFEREIPKNVEVEVRDVANHFNTKMEITKMLPTLVKDEAIPYVIDPVSRETLTYTNKNADGTVDATLEIVFDKDLREDKITGAKAIEDHFALYELEVAKRNEKTNLIKSVEIKEDTVTVKFRGLKEQNPEKDNDYVLEVKRFEDQKGNRMETTYIDFEVKEASTKFGVDSISVGTSRDYSYASEIVINFRKNQSVNKAKAEDVNNYFLGKGGTKRADVAYVEKDGNRVVLLIKDKTVAEVRDMEVLEISTNLKNSADRATVENRFWNLKTEKQLNDPTIDPDPIVTSELTGAKIVEAHKLEVTDAVAAKYEINNATTDLKFIIIEGERVLVDADVEKTVKAIKDARIIGVEDVTSASEIITITGNENGKALDVKTEVKTAAGIETIAPVVAKTGTGIEKAPAKGQKLELTFDNLPKDLKVDSVVVMNGNVLKVVEVKTNSVVAETAKIEDVFTAADDITSLVINGAEVKATGITVAE